MRKPVFNGKILQGIYNEQKCSCKIEYVNGDYVVYDLDGQGAALVSLSDKQILELLLTGEITYGKIQLNLDVNF